VHEKDCKWRIEGIEDGGAGEKVLLESARNAALM
jgi:hypothetical protein